MFHHPLLVDLNLVYVFVIVLALNTSVLLVEYDTYFLLVISSDGR